MTMRFLSDNAARVCPEAMAAIIEADSQDRPYDGDAFSQRLDAAFSDLFGTEVAAFWMTTGTVANALALAMLCRPIGRVLCHRHAHIEEDEGGAPEFYTHGAKLTLVEGENGKLTTISLEATADQARQDVHGMPIELLSITNASEWGRVYSVDETRALGGLVKERGWHFHLDGARFANAVAHLGCHPGDLSWRAGVDILSFGFIKNGGMSAEALILFDPARADELKRRRKRGGHLSSKGRYGAAQLLAMIENDVWLRNARAANAGAASLAAAAGDRLVQPCEANITFVRANADEAAALRRQGFDFYDWSAGIIRLVVSWDQPQSEIDVLADALRRL